MSDFIPLEQHPRPPARPVWLKVRAPVGPAYAEYTAVAELVREQRLHTVCSEAHCPNIGECWSQRTATFLLLGNVCTRGCRYCAIGKGRPAALDLEEPVRVAEAVATLELRHAVLTSVNRDDLSDGGAGIFAASITAIRERLPSCRVEVLIPDFDGNLAALDLVLAARPDVLNHNIETIERLFRRFRPRASYRGSLALLRHARMVAGAGLVTKSGIMVGVGETDPEVMTVLDDLRAADVDVVTIGQYLAPSSEHWPIDRYVRPEQFVYYQQQALQRGFRHAECGPLVRSSYHARRHVPE